MKGKATGVVLVFIDERGNAIAHAGDFERSAPGGFSLREGQRRRAERQLAFAVCNAYASPMLVRGLDPWDCERVMERLCRSHGCKVHEVAIGHEEPQSVAAVGQRDESPHLSTREEKDPSVIPPATRGDE